MGLLLFSALCLLPAVFGAIDLSTYPLSTVLRQGNGDIYTLHWSFNVQDETIRFAVNVSTTGWVGLGLSPNGGMADSDIAIGWVNSQGQAFLNDRYATTTARPPVDAQQNWFLDEGSEERGFTILAFRRDWVTCDNQDREIEANTARVIFSWNDQDPDNDDPNQVMYHGSTNRGSISLNLLGGQQDVPPDPVDLQTFTAAVDSVSLPSSDTTYWCSAFELPTEVQQQKHYITKYGPVITEGNENVVHHILLYECASLDGASVGTSAVCGGGEVSDTINECRRGTVLAAWAIGGVEFVYPADVAYPIGGAGATRYLVMETHYDNPDMRSDIVDSSGLVLSYSTMPRQHEAGVLQVGHSVSRFMVVPPGTPNYNIFGDCSSQCTSAYFPSGGINIFANLLHTHLVGAGLTLHHVRNNAQCGYSEELAPVEQNLEYDFNYQQYNFLPRNVNVLPGDLLRLECNYNTMDRTGVVLGGDATTDEMCLAFAVYYPRTTLTACFSTPNLGHSQVFQPFLSDYIPSVSGPLSFSTSRSTLEGALNNVSWTSDAIASLENSIFNGPLLDVCVPSDAESTQDFQFLPNNNGFSDIQCDYQSANECTNFQPTPCCDRQIAGAVTVYGNVVLVIVLSLTIVLSLFI